ncbi:cell division protein pelota, putative [Eimeria mitis]|uniref:Cell division protein pelota, putative n=1 Tax=Eimeria mitis TaxID=44415 RepID=U6JNQ6_9EIME|nr:cell division protein pelota, putative [Eimeria mitis]CDJ27134.1 cell division protein pelota, putative [Eimeria mitis]
MQTAAHKGAETLTFSDQHPTGEQLALLGGVAAILRFPVMEEEEEEQQQEDAAAAAAAAAAEAAEEKREMLL